MILRPASLLMNPMIQSIAVFIALSFLGLLGPFAPPIPECITFVHAGMATDRLTNLTYGVE